MSQYVYAYLNVSQCVRAHSLIWCTCPRHRLIDRYLELHNIHAWRSSARAVEGQRVHSLALHPHGAADASRLLARQRGSCGAASAAMDAVQPQRGCTAATRLGLPARSARTRRAERRTHTESAPHAHAARRSNTGKPTTLSHPLFSCLAHTQREQAGGGRGERQALADPSDKGPADTYSRTPVHPAAQRSHTRTYTARKHTPLHSHFTVFTHPARPTATHTRAHKHLSSPSFKLLQPPPPLHPFCAATRAHTQTHKPFSRRARSIARLLLRPSPGQNVCHTRALAYIPASPPPPRPPPPPHPSYVARARAHPRPARLPSHCWRPYGGAGLSAGRTGP